MANFFETGDPEKHVNETSTETASPASQAAQKFRAELLGQILNAMGQPKPGFAQYAGGQGYPQAPGGMGEGIGALLEAMGQEGAFTSTRTGTADITGHGATPSEFMDLMDLIGTGLGLLPALDKGLGTIGNILKPIGGMLGLGNTNQWSPGPESYYGVGSSGYGGAEPSGAQNTVDSLFSTGPSIYPDSGSQFLNDILNQDWANWSGGY
jgi:hypothetical protein